MTASLQADVKSPSVEALSTGGLLANAIKGFQARDAQQQMAAAVEQAIAEQAVLLVEAGTGTGKTFAYLVPAMLSGEKVIVSTGTKHLQDQLFHKDLPLLLKSLGLKLNIAQLKGRSNYFCHHRYAAAELELRDIRSEDRGYLAQLGRWGEDSKSGDIAEGPDIPENWPFWHRVTSTADNCLGTECPNYDECFVANARKKAHEADVVVTNHYLLFADMAVKETGFGELLPAAGVYVLDEAHQIPEIATRYFGTTIGGRQIDNLARDAVNEQKQLADDDPVLIDLADTVTKTVAGLRNQFGEHNVRDPLSQWIVKPEVRNGIDGLRNQVAEFSKHLSSVAERSPGLQTCFERATELAARLALLTNEPSPGKTEVPNVKWVETTLRTFSLHLTPLDISERFSQAVYSQDASWILTSATLAIGERFDHFANRLGLKDPAQLKLDSPFEYRKNAVMYSPKNMPAPNSPEFLDRAIDEAIPLIRAAGGRCFFLFTSHAALKKAADRLAAEIRFPLLVQGQAPRHELIQQFRERGNAVLLGTSSFWEGVDVRGDALSLVIIDKLPFSSPGDPVLAARLDAVKESGGSPFFDLQLPHAVITLKQGAGRLIRDAEDKGVLMICDPRLISKSYGRTFIESLPPMAKTQRQEAVVGFLDHILG
ncbi:MAG: ATP-dependent DNA helicase DinG [Pseudoalteromonas tetraodonis]|jgi:ATP-dependent DNA helicase DinG